MNRPLEQLTSSVKNEKKKSQDGKGSGPSIKRTKLWFKMLAEQTGKMISTEKEILAAFAALRNHPEKTCNVSLSHPQHLMIGNGDKLGSEECK